MDICQDKSKSAKIWLSQGIPCPKTIIITSPNDLQNAAEQIGYPFWMRATQGAGGRGSTLVNNLETGKAWLRYWESREEISMNFIAQQYLPGLNLAWQSIWKDGELVVSQARERIEYIYPYLAVSGVTGTPVVAKTVNMPEKWKKIAEDAVLSIDEDASGIFCVDLKGDKNGIPNPTEINCGRFFTTSAGFSSLGAQLGVSGANMPWVSVKLGLGEKVGPFPKFDILPSGWHYIRHIDICSSWVPNKVIEETQNQEKFIPKRDFSK